MIRKRASAIGRVEPRLIPRASRGAQHASRFFTAASADRLTYDWGSSPLTADDIIRRDHRALVARSREQAANNDYARAYVRAAVQNIVGPQGVTLQSQAQLADGSLDSDLNDAVEDAWADFGRPCSCDVAQRASLRAIQAEAVSSAARDGEFIIRKVTGPDAGPWGLSLQVLDPQRCPVDLDETRRRDGTFIRSGVEFSQAGRPLAYYFTATSAEDSDYLHGSRRFARVPADEIVHGFVPEMPGQKRGIPWMASALWRLRMLKGFEDAALVNARQGANKLGFFEWDPDYAPKDPGAAGEEPFEYISEPGTFSELPVGLRFKGHDPSYPSGELAVFTKSMLRGASAGMGVAYNLLANDLEGVNYSSIRQGAVDEREHWKMLQQWLIEQMLQPVFEAWLPRALLAGLIRVRGRPVAAARLDELRRPQWQGRRWAWVDPLKDVQAELTALRSATTSLSHIIREHGRDPKTVWKEIAADIEAMREAGIDDELIASIMTGSRRVSHTASEEI